MLSRLGSVDLQNQNKQKKSPNQKANKPHVSPPGSSTVHPTKRPQTKISKAAIVLYFN